MTPRSPFPGMDPHLEKHWGDVHHRLVQYSCDALQGNLPDDLVARVEERVFMEADDVRVRSIAPDNFVSERIEAAGGGTGRLTESEVAVAEPRLFLFEEDETTEGFIEIRDRDGGRVVTVIEFLSPANKAGGEGTRQYQQKQHEVLQSSSSLVEIDLVRAGTRVLALPAPTIPRECRKDYLACIRRSWRMERELYSFPLRRRLPALAIPLRKTDRPIALDLQAILDQAYRNGRYDRLNYSLPLEPPLDADDQTWADEILKAAGKR